MIHSFWVPELFGKQDVMPGRTNHILFSDRHAGHLHGAVRGVLRAAARPHEARGRRPRPGRLGGLGRDSRPCRPTPTDPLAKKGEQLFLNPLSDGRGNCTACHAWAMLGGSARPEPVALRRPHARVLRGVQLDVPRRGSPRALAAWLENPGAVKLGAKMPDYELSPDEIDALVAYLYSLT